MKRWKQWLRLAVVAAASFVLLVTVLPEVASGIGLSSLGSRLASSGNCTSGGSGSSSSSCCSGSSGSSSSGSSSACQTGPGVVSGKITITGAPSGFVAPYEGAGACPVGGATGLACATPDYVLSSGGTYSLSLPAGSWVVAGFYELAPYGGAFIGAAHVVTVPAGGAVVRNVSVQYRQPATVSGSVTVTGVPSGVSVTEVEALLCPSFAPYTGGSVSIACVQEYASSSGDTGTYKVATLPPGTWTVYPGFCFTYSCTYNANAGMSVKVAGGGSYTVNVTTPFVLPGEGILTGTLTVTGAPAGFADPEAVLACQSGTTSCSYLYLNVGSTFVGLLPTGTWQVTGYYEVPPYYNGVPGPSMTVKVKESKVTTVALSVPYRTLGGASGAVHVTGLPKGVAVTSYTVLACPISAPWSGGQPDITCVQEYSGPAGYGAYAADRKHVSPAAHGPAAPTRLAKGAFSRYVLSTLTAGKWLLYPGYQTVLATYVDPTPTTVKVAAGKTTSKAVSVPYQVPTVGAVTGSVTVIGAPSGGVQAGVRACTAPPTASPCAGEIDAYADATGRYVLPLSPGTWWVQGLVDLYTGSSSNQFFSAVEQVTVTVGAVTKASFVVTVG